MQFQMSGSGTLATVGEDQQLDGDDQEAALGRLPLSDYTIDGGTSPVAFHA